jgi:hypothetical protein
MDMHVRGEDILHYEPFAAAGLVKHLIGRRYGGGIILHG